MKLKEMKTLVKIPFGPQHPALEEPINFMFEVKGEFVVRVKPRLGYIHRGIEKIAETRSYNKNIYLAERICGICSFAHTTCYVQTIEMLLNVEIPKRAKFIRTIMAEMERIQNHFLWLGATAKGMGFETLFMYTWRDREMMLEVLEMITGKRVNFGMNTIGGVRRDIKNSMRKKIEITLNKIEDRAKFYKKICAKERSFIKRTKDIGILRPQDAKRLCTVGPTLRGSGVSNDVRVTEPYAAYKDIPFKVITYDECDVLSRVFVRIEEIIESIKIIRTSLEMMSDEPILTTCPKKIPQGEAISRVEAPRGELLYYLRSDGSDKPERFKVRAPTLANIPALCKMLTNINIADIPVVIAGIDPCIACAERVLIIDSKKRKRVISETELWRYAKAWYQKK
jgi:NADH-quinone oxidoreductase subunit D